MRAIAGSLILALATCGLAQDHVDIQVDATKPTVAVSPSLYGIFFEEINQAGEGGIYGELLQGSGMNGARGGHLPPGWLAGHEATFDPGTKLHENRPGSILIQGKGDVANRGFWGLSLPSGTYRFTAWVRTDQPLTASISGDGTSFVLATANPKFGWQQIERTFRCERLPENPSPGPSTFIDADFKYRTGHELQLNFKGSGAGKSWIGFASLTAASGDGLRPDLDALVTAMRPRFVRFPGGCFVEGQDFSRTWSWKDSIGPRELRKGMEAGFWGYPISNGLGFHEYLQWCEKMRAAPLFVANTGMNHSQITPLGEMDHWVQNALDAIEYANGPVTSKWGAERAKNGHPAPFNLKYVEIGNENGFNWSFGGAAPYADRYKIMFDAIKAKYPKIVCIADVPVPHPMDVVDEHYYQSPAWFWANDRKYDAYDRKGPKIYVGEYAVTQGSGAGNLDAALGEAAFMTGMERNSDVVTMSSYAPLFVNVNNRQWNPDAIVFDAARSYGTPSYWVQALFGQNRPDVNVQHTFTLPPPAPAKAFSGAFGVQTWKTSAEFKDLRISVDGEAGYSSGNVHVDRISSNKGSWSYDEQTGILRQDSLDEDVRMTFAGSRIDRGQKVTMEIKARKISGDEGFIIMFQVDEGNTWQWNVGGWGNRQNAFQYNGSVVGTPQPGHIDSDRWYDIRIERVPGEARAYLDGQLVQTMKDPPRTEFSVVAGVDRRANQLILKVVNGSEYSRIANLTLTGVLAGSSAKGIVLTGDHLSDENTFDHPDNIAPRTFVLKDIREHLTQAFAPRSLTILRIPLDKKRNQ